MIELLQKVGPSIIQPLCEYAARSPPDSLDWHYMVLRKFGPKSAQALSADLNSANPNLRYLAIKLAAEFPDASQKSVDWLTPYLVDPDKNIRMLALTNWLHKQTDARQRISLLSKDINDPDLQETAINLAAELKSDASPLLPAIHAAIDKADEKTKIEYMGDVLDIDPNDDKTYENLISYLSSTNDDLVEAAIDSLSDDTLRKRSYNAIDKLYKDPKTSIPVKTRIESVRMEASSEEQSTDKK